MSNKPFFPFLRSSVLGVSLVIAGLVLTSSFVSLAEVCEPAKGEYPDADCGQTCTKDEACHLFVGDKFCFRCFKKSELTSFCQEAKGEYRDRACNRACAPHEECMPFSEDIITCYMCREKEKP